MKNEIWKVLASVAWALVLFSWIGGAPVWFSMFAAVWMFRWITEDGRK